MQAVARSQTEERMANVGVPFARKATCPDATQRRPALHHTREVASVHAHTRPAWERHPSPGCQASRRARTSP